MSSKKSNKIIDSKSLFFKRDKQNGGILFGQIRNPLKDLFVSLGQSSVQNNQHNASFLKATKSEAYNIKRNDRRKNILKKEGGFLTQHFFPSTGYSSTSTTLGVAAKMTRGGKRKINKKGKK